ncbi:MAG: LCP family protein [Actinomycetota bacterium]
MSAGDDLDVGGRGPVGEQVELPSVGTGRRFRRRQERDLARRRRRASIVAVIVLVASVLGTYAVLRPLFDDDEEAADPDVTGAEEVEVAADPTPKALLVQVDDDGALVAATVAVVDGTGRGGGVVFIPASSLLDVPSFGLETLTGAYENDGIDLVGLTIENLLGVSFDHVALVDDSSWAELVGEAAPLQVENPNPIETVDDGRIIVTLDAGPAQLTADEVGDFLSARSTDEPDLNRLLRHDVVWRAWLEGLSAIDYPIADVRADLQAFFHALADGPVDYRLLPVETISGTGADTQYEPVTDEIDELVGEFAPDAVAGANRRIRVQLLNGAGTPGLAPTATDLLVPAGARIDLRDNARTFDYGVTQFVYYRDEQRQAAERLRDALGLGEVVRDRNPIDVVDVTVVLGRDFVDRYIEGG